MSFASHHGSGAAFLYDDLMPIQPSTIPQFSWTIRTPLVPDRQYEVLALYLRFPGLLASLPGMYHDTMLMLATRRAEGLVADGYPMRMWRHEFWKLSIWESVPALSRFVHAPVHQTAMKALQPRLSAGSVSRIPVLGADLPPTNQMLQDWLAGGRSLVSVPTFPAQPMR
jgi:hypothetical protein